MADPESSEPPNGAQASAPGPSLLEATTDVLHPLVALLLGLVVSLLPERGRRPFRDLPLPLALATGLTGFIEMGFALFMGAALYSRMMDGIRAELLAQTMSAALDGRAAVDQGTVFGLGAMLYIYFLLSPPGLLSLFVFCEGMARMTIAALTMEPCGLSLLSLADHALDLPRLYRSVRNRSRRPDVITREGADDLKVRSEWDRDWGPLDTVRHDGRLWAVVEVNTLESGPFPHVYRLSPAPEGRVVRRLIEYDPRRRPPPRFAVNDVSESGDPAGSASSPLNHGGQPPTPPQTPGAPAPQT